MTELERESELLLQVVNAVHSAHDLESALRGTARALQARFPIWHASLWVHDTDREVVRVVGSWSISDTAFNAGVEVSTSITPPLARMLVDLHAGKVFATTMDDHGASLLDHLMREEGVAGLLTVPLSRTGSEMLFLALGSSDEHGFAEAPPSLFLSLAASAGARFAKLATASRD